MFIQYVYVPRFLGICAPGTVRARTVSDARHASDTARPILVDSVRRVSAARGSAVSDACRASDTFRVSTVSDCPNWPR